MINNIQHSPFQDVKTHAKLSFLGASSMSFLWLLLMSQGYFALPLLPLAFFNAGVNSFLTALILPSALLLGLMATVIGVNFFINKSALFLQWLGFKTPDSHPWPYGLQSTVNNAHIAPGVKVALHSEFTHELKEMKNKVDNLSRELSRLPTLEELTNRGLMPCFHLQRNQMEFVQLLQSNDIVQTQTELIQQRTQNFNRRLGVKNV